MLDRGKWILDNVSRVQTAFFLLGLVVGAPVVTVVLVRAVIDLPFWWLFVLGVALAMVAVSGLGVLLTSRAGSPAPIVPIPGTLTVHLDEETSRMYLNGSVYVTNDSPATDLQPVSFQAARVRRAGSGWTSNISAEPSHFSIRKGDGMWRGGSIVIKPNETTLCRITIPLGGDGPTPPSVDAAVVMIDQFDRRHPRRLRFDRRERPVHGERAHAAFRIMKAQYGAEDAWADVTDLVRSHVIAGRLNMHVTNDSMGRDPIENVPKLLTITYEQNGGMLVANFPEESRAVLPDIAL